MGKKVICVENVSKIYRLGEFGTGTLSTDVNRWWVTKVLGKEDPYLKIGQVNNRSTKGDSDVVYSLKNVSFDVEQGEVLGIIGKNGAGKSTLLKILSQITSPTIGRVRMKGRVASLLEVGTGFHPELTGRENIFLNGSILGMRKHEITRKLDEIIEFSGVERYIDTPVKRYSSGMYVRLAFAVAAHLESEILIVDEVLAVGDAEFQKKCLSRMKDVSTNEGRTVLFVSHNHFAVKQLCDNAILIKNGKIESYGAVENIVNLYNQRSSISKIWKRSEASNSDIFINTVSVSLQGQQPNHKLNVVVQIIVKKAIANKGFLAFYISSFDSAPIMEAIPNYTFLDFNFSNVAINVESIIELNGIIPGSYYLGIWMGIGHHIQLDWLKEVVSFEVKENPVSERMAPYPSHSGHIVPFSSVISVVHSSI
jgi:lipopolysaccharide transport system ATP-binding protein